MNRNSRNALIDFAHACALFACDCSLAERESGHKLDCPAVDLDALAFKLEEALETDETILP